MVRVTQYMRKPRQNSFSMERLFSDLRAASPHDLEISVSESLFLSNGILRRLVDGIRSIFRQGDVNHVTGDVHFITMFLSARKTILTVHDCVMLDRLSGPKYWIIWLFWYWLPIRRARLVTVISEETKKGLLRHVNVRDDKIVIVPNCVSSEFKPVPKPFNRECPKVIQVGTGPNKNLERVVAAIEGIRCKLVVIGRLSPSQLGLLVEKRIDFENHFGISREEMVRQYESSDLLVFASTYEGFGLPIIEANAVGRPVITSCFGAMMEVADGAAVMVDPFSVDDIRRGILDVMNDQELRERMVKLGHINVSRYKSSEIANLYARLYREVALGC